MVLAEAGIQRPWPEPTQQTTTTNQTCRRNKHSFTHTPFYYISSNPSVCRALPKIIVKTVVK